MAYAISPKVGGPFICEEPCQHTDCNWNRDLIVTPCRYCGEPIGEDRRYNTEKALGSDRYPCHAVCLDEHFEKQHPFPASESKCTMEHD